MNFFYLDIDLVSIPKINNMVEIQKTKILGALLHGILIIPTKEHLWPVIIEGDRNVACIGMQTLL